MDILKNRASEAAFHYIYIGGDGLKPEVVFGCIFACGIKHPISSSGAFGCNFASGIKHPISSSGGFWVQFCLWHQTLNFLILFAGLLPHGTKPSSYWAGWWTVAGIPNLWT